MIWPATCEHSEQNVVNGILIRSQGRPRDRAAVVYATPQKSGIFSTFVFLNQLLKRPALGFREGISKSRIPDMTAAPLFPGFDGLMTLSRREGVDIRPTLLRVLTDLYVQASAHSADEERQFVELTSRLIDQVDDATRAAVRARLAVYPATPFEIMNKLGLRRAHSGQPAPVAPSNPPATS